MSHNLLNEGQLADSFEAAGERMACKADPSDPSVPPERFTIYRIGSLGSEGLLGGEEQVQPIGSIDFVDQPPIITPFEPQNAELLRVAALALAEKRATPVMPKREWKRGGRSFADMTMEERQALGSKGGRASQAGGMANRFNSETARVAARLGHEKGVAHTWTSETARQAGRKGGATPRRTRPSASASTANATASSTASATANVTAKKDGK